MGLRTLKLKSIGVKLCQSSTRVNVPSPELFNLFIISFSVLYMTYIKLDILYEILVRISYIKYVLDRMLKLWIKPVNRKRYFVDLVVLPK